MNYYLRFCLCLGFCLLNLVMYYLEGAPPFVALFFLWLILGVCYFNEGINDDKKGA